jgi:hypothetical protein
MLVLASYNNWRIRMPIEIGVKIHREDYERLMQAFKDGKLADLGIIDIVRITPEKPDGTEGQWTGTEGKRRRIPKRPDLPPHS